jgi:uncharacterized lipoprotein YddW (UPF0748 family)
MNLRLKIFYSLFIFVLISLSLPAYASSPLALVKSEKNQEAYSDQHLGTFDDDWLAFRRTIETSNVRFDVISDQDLINGGSKLSSYKVIILPMLIDLPTAAVNTISDYVRSGGKIIVTDGGGSPTENAQKINQLTGVQVKGHNTMQDKLQLVWSRTPLPFTQDFSVGTTYANFHIVDNGALQSAKWINTNGQEVTGAICNLNGNIYLSWAPGLQGEITSNSQVLSLALEDSVPGITQQAAVQISFADYQNIQQELDYLIRRTEESIQTAKQADLAVPFKTIQEHYEVALQHVKNFQTAYQERRFLEADSEAAQARHEFSLAFAKSMPVRPVEARSVWLDRGTIINCKTEAAMSDLFDRLKSAGINVVYFETNNAGFCMFPTQISTPHPDLHGFDALGTAVKEAHKRGMELHSWIWTFAVGNLRHNPIIGRESDYPGPVLSSHAFNWALARQNGALLPNNQPEFWIDPANLDGRRFVKDLAVEIVSKYPVDGLQFDYIRYPFNGKGTEMGFDWTGRLRFEKETGLNLDKLDEETRQMWQTWKIAQVNSFVEETSKATKKIRPGLRISVAVYGTPKRLRLGNIQQEWEAWIRNGWIDTVNPMTYVPTAKDLSIMAGFVRESSEDKALVYPGLSIRQLDTAGLIEQLDTARAIGTLGTTIFAVAQLDDKKLNVLKLGPYRRYTMLTPQSDPLKASRLLFDDFASMVNRYFQDPKKRILSDQSSTNEVFAEIESVQKQIHSLSSKSSAEELSDAVKQVSNLQNDIKNWLRIEAFIQRGYRAQYIVSYLTQVQAILTYAFHQTKVNAVASQL